MNLQKLLSFVRKACDEYGMIEDGDRIAVGVSGGKDSLALLAALSSMRRFYPKKYSLFGITVDLGLGADYSKVSEFCENLGVDYRVVETDIGHVIFEDRKEKNPCSLCSKMRKGALDDAVVELGCNKVAFGHNKDDVVETFLLCLFFEGRIHTFSPVTYLSRKNIHSIRPLLLTPEKDIIDFSKSENLPVVKNPCPADGYTKRAEMKEFLKTNAGNFPQIDDKVFTAIIRSDLKGWKKDTS